MLIWNSNIKLPQNLHDGIIDIIEKNYISLVVVVTQKQFSIVRNSVGLILG